MVASAKQLVFEFVLLVRRGAMINSDSVVVWDSSSLPDASSSKLALSENSSETIAGRTAVRHKLHKVSGVTLLGSPWSSSCDPGKQESPKKPFKISPLLQFCLSKNPRPFPTLTNATWAIPPNSGKHAFDARKSSNVLKYDLSWIIATTDAYCSYSVSA